MALGSIAVFCGSRFGDDPSYADLARATGRTLAEQGTTVVYGGGHVGLMGAVADAALEVGGRVIGVIPQALADREVEHRGLTELHVVGDKHERKALMAQLSDAFIALPGGVGTLEEITEQWTWQQLAIHAKPSVFLDAGDFWAPMRLMVDRMVGEGFVTAEGPSIPYFTGDLTDALAELERRSAPVQLPGTEQPFDPEDLV